MLGEKAGLHQTAVAHFEAGRRSPCAFNLAALAAALGVGVDSLLAVESA